MERKKRIELFKKWVGAYRCPVCGESFCWKEPGSFVCGNGHCFDIAAKGYINFLTAPRRADYDRELFLNRRGVFAEGFYVPVAEALRDVAAKFVAGKSCFSILDAGCGEGYFAGELAGMPEVAAVFAMDIEKEAVRMAAGTAAANFFVGDIAHIPLRDGAADMVLNVLSPANYGEFARVLKPGGVVVKVVPGAGYLKEVRGAVAGLRGKEHPGEETVAYFEKQMRIVGRERIFYSLPATREQAERFLRMTPMTRGVDVDGADVSVIRQITIDLDVLVGTVG